MASGDVNGDGRRDAVVSHRISGLFVCVLLGSGAGGFLPPFTAPVTREARALVLGDLNGDGFDDLVAGSLPDGDFHLEVLLGSASGRLTHFTDLNNGSAVVIAGEAIALADMDRDGDLDVVTSTFGDIAVLRNRGDATFEAPVEGGAGSGAVEALVVDDFNRDAIPDVAAFVWTGSDDFAQSRLLLNLGTGGGQVAFAQSLDLDGNHPRAVAGRVDGDPWPDLVVTGTSGTHGGVGGLYYLRNTGGSFALQLHQPSAPGGNIVGADFNGDGRLEVASSRVGPPGQIELRVSGAAGALDQVLVLPGVNSPYDMLAGDFAGSPWPDLTVLNSQFNPSTVVLFENGTRTTDVTPSLGVARLGLSVTTLPGAGQPVAIRYRLHESGTRVRLTVHDVAGRLVRVLERGISTAGEHPAAWDREDAGGRRVARGVYIVRLEAGNQSIARKAVVVHE